MGILEVSGWSLYEVERWAFSLIQWGSSYPLPKLPKRVQRKRASNCTIPSPWFEQNGVKKEFILLVSEKEVLRTWKWDDSGAHKSNHFWIVTNSEGPLSRKMADRDGASQKGANRVY